MQWVALVNWVLVVCLALGAAGVPLPSLGMQAICALAGLGTMIVFAAGGGGAWAWISFAFACAGTLAGAVGSYTLVQDESATMQATASGRKEMVAAVEGATVPFFFVAVLLSLAVAAG